MKRETDRVKVTEIKFYEDIEDELLKFAVIISKTQSNFVFCRHKDRNTWEVPGGHREPGESIMDTARRELYEETGALEFDIKPVCVYSVTAPDNLNDGRESFGMLFFADIKRFETELHSEIEEIKITPELPEKWTYPEIQPKLMEEAGRRGYLLVCEAPIYSNVPQREEFTCRRDNLTIKGVRYLCQRGEGYRYPALIASHGFTDNYTGMEVYCRELCKEGYAAFCFSFCGGGSIGEAPEVHSDGDSRDMDIFTEADDLCAVIEYVRSLDYIDGERIILMGASQGGFVSGLAAARCREGIRKLIMLYPALCIPDHARRGCLGGASYDAANVPEEIVCRRTVLGRKFHDNVCGVDAFLELTGYKGPVLIIHGSEDEVVECSYSMRARDSYGKGQCALQIFRGMGHGSDEAQLDSVIASMRQFLAGRREALSFEIVITRCDVTCQGDEKHSDIYFTGYCDSPEFRGTIMPEGVDRQVSENGETKSGRAEYTFEGIDGDGERCRLHVVNQWGGKDWKPVITTDSRRLEWLNGADLTAVLEGYRGGLTVRVFAECGQ